MSLESRLVPDLDDKEHVTRAASRAKHPIPIIGREPDARNGRAKVAAPRRVSHTF